MTLIEAVLKQVLSPHSINGGSENERKVHGHSGHIRRHHIHSPPPELEVLVAIEKKHRLKGLSKKNKYAALKPKVDTSPPIYHARHMFKKLPDWAGKRRQLDAENMDIVLAIKRAHFTRGRVDSRWKHEPKLCPWGYYNRLNAIKRITFDNKLIYKRLIAQGPKIDTTKSLMEDWAKNRKDIVGKATMKFVLFPPIPQEDIEDPAFVKPIGVRRPRVFFTLTFENGADIGELQAELFTDICPKTCGLFLELLRGDGVGFSYIGTHFFRKVPKLYWSGGDVARDNGFGCYAQKGLRVPIGAENYHFSHSMPGLLSMSVTRDDEMCGIFNITFKPLPQLDLRNVVFGRIVRPSELFTGLSDMGKLLSTHPRVVMSASRQKLDGQWVRGAPNTMIVPATFPRKKLQKSV